MIKTLQSIWDAGGTVFNSILKLSSAFSVEIMASQGWDSLTIDLQHAPLSHHDALLMLQSIFNTSTVPLVRVPWNEPSIIMRMLDAGCAGVICPMVNTRAEADAFVGACYYAPAGYRSYGPYRKGLDAGSEDSNDAIIPIAMIETGEALENLDDILSVTGLDTIFVGPTDLSRSMGIEASLNEPPLRDALEQIVTTARAHEVVAGIYTGTIEDALQVQEMGYRFITLSADAYILRAGAGELVNSVRP